MNGLEIVICIIWMVMASFLLCLQIAGRTIKISYKISVWSWVLTEFASFWIMLTLMLSCSALNIGEMKKFTDNSIVNKWMAIFVQQGGLVLLVIVFAGCINRILIISFDLDVLKRYSTIYSKINFTFSCISCSFIFFYCANKTLTEDENSIFLGQSIMWAVVMVEAWVTYDGFSKARKRVDGDKKNGTHKNTKLNDNDADTLRDKIKKYWKSFKNKVKEIWKAFIKYEWKPIVGLIVGPFFLFLLMKYIISQNIEVPEIKKIYLILFIVWAVIFVLIAFIVGIIRNPSDEKAIEKIQSIIDDYSDSNKNIIYIRNFKVEILFENEKYKAQIIIGPIDYRKGKGLSDKDKTELERLSGKKNTEIYCKDDVDKMVAEINTKLEDLFGKIKKYSDKTKNAYIKETDNS